MMKNRPTEIAALARQSWKMIHEVSAHVVSERLRHLNATLAKYSPTQPRVPAGSAAGGQWTSRGGENGNILNTNDPSPDQVINGSELLYPDGTPIINPNTGLPYPQPEGLNIPANVDFAHAYVQADSSWLARTFIMIGLFRQGGSYDYQRPEGLIPTMLNSDNFQGDYIDVTNYNYGVISAAFGYSEEAALLAAGAHNRFLGNTGYEDITKYGISQAAVNNISQGYSDYYRVYQH